MILPMHIILKTNGSFSYCFCSHCVSIRTGSEPTSEPPPSRLAAHLATSTSLKWTPMSTDRRTMDSAVTTGNGNDVASLRYTNPLLTKERRVARSALYAISLCTQLCLHTALKHCLLDIIPIASIISSCYDAHFASSARTPVCRRQVSIVETVCCLVGGGGGGRGTDGCSHVWPQGAVTL